MAEPYPYQMNMVQIMEREQRFGVWMDTGTGKTMTSLAFMSRNTPWPALILCPKTIIRPAWVEDWRKFGFHAQYTLKACTGTPKERKEVLREVSAGEVDAIVTNYEAFRATPEMRTIPWRCIILDESTRIMNPKAKTTLMVHEQCHRECVEYVFCLSGCPTPNSKQEFWGQVHAFRPGHLEPSFWAFRAARFYQPNAKLSWLWQPRPGAEERLVDEVSEVSAFIRKEDCLDLPDVTHEVREVQLSAREKQMYDKFLRTWVLEFGGEVIVGATALSELMKLRQFTAGVVKMPDGEWVEFGDTKLKALVELIQDIGKDPHGKTKPVIVVGQFRREIERIADRLLKEGRRVGILYGGLSDAERDGAIRGFQCGDLDCLVVHPASAGHGLTFTNCSDMVFSSLDYSYERYYQVMQRIHRIGQTNKCTYHYLLATGTVDQNIHEALTRKESANMKMVEAFRKIT